MKMMALTSPETGLGVYSKMKKNEAFSGKDMVNHVNFKGKVKLAPKSVIWKMLGIHENRESKSIQFVHCPEESVYLFVCFSI